MDKSWRKQIKKCTNFRQQGFYEQIEVLFAVNVVINNAICVLLCLLNSKYCFPQKLWTNNIIKWVVSLATMKCHRVTLQKKCLIRELLIKYHILAINVIIKQNTRLYSKCDDEVESYMISFAHIIPFFKEVFKKNYELQHCELSFINDDKMPSGINAIKNFLCTSSSLYITFR